jgi:DNA-binding transcriptional LysR family regulator
VNLPVHLNPSAEAGRLEAPIARVVSGPGIGLIPASLAAPPRASVTTIPTQEDQVTFGMAWREDRQTTLVDAFLATAQGEPGRVAAQSPRLARV